MKSKSESSRRSRRPLIKAAPGMLAMTFFSGCRCRGYPYGGGYYGDGGGGRGGETAGTGGVGGTGGIGGIGGLGGAGGAGGMEMLCDATCAEAISFGTPLCDTAPQTSQDLYKAFWDCSCMRAQMDPMPGCSDLCGDNVCTGAAPSADCGTCMQTGVCAADFAACIADL